MAILNLTLDADGTIDSVMHHDAGSNAPFFTHLNDVADGVSLDFIENDSGLETNTYDSWFSLSNVSGNFFSMDSFGIDIDIQQTGTVTTDTLTLTARIFDADNDTSNPLTDESSTLGDETDNNRVQNSFLFAGVSSGNKAQWNSAYIRFRYDYVQNFGDFFELRIYGCTVSGNYTTRAQDIFNITDASDNGSQQLGRIRVFHPGDITLSGRNGETYDPDSADLPSSTKAITTISNKYADKWDDPTYYAGDLD